MKYPLVQIKSGDGDSGMWVGIRFRSKNGEQHDLYTVGGEESDKRPVGRTPVPIYFEKDDQSLSCYEGADNITVTARAIALTLNKNGQVCLELPKTVEFVAAKAGKDFKEARAMFVA